MPTIAQRFLEIQFHARNRICVGDVTNLPEVTCINFNIVQRPLKFPMAVNVKSTPPSSLTHCNMYHEIIDSNESCTRKYIGKSGC